MCLQLFFCITVHCILVQESALPLDLHDKSVSFAVGTRASCILSSEHHVYVNLYCIKSSTLPYTGGRRKRGRNVLVSTSANYEKVVSMSNVLDAKQKFDFDLAISVFEMDCLETPFPGVFANMYGLASVLGRSIQSIYPCVNEHIRLL